MSEPVASPFAKTLFDRLTRGTVYATPPMAALVGALAGAFAGYAVPLVVLAVAKDALLHVAFAWIFCATCALSGAIVLKQWVFRSLALLLIPLETFLALCLAQGANMRNETAFIFGLVAPVFAMAVLGGAAKFSFKGLILGLVGGAGAAIAALPFVNKVVVSQTLEMSSKCLISGAVVGFVAQTAISLLLCFARDPDADPAQAQVAAVSADHS